MIVAELDYECFADTDLDSATAAINNVIEALRYNGQILGREFPLTFKDGIFTSRVMMPKTNALLSQFHSGAVREALQALNKVHLLAPKLKLRGQDLLSLPTSDDVTQPLVLYTHYLHTCSPLFGWLDFQPVPLYELPISDELRFELIKWQEDWQACDQTQNNGRLSIESACVAEISEPTSSLSQWSVTLREQLANALQRPVYLYLYRVGGQDYDTEQQRTCPSCQGSWLQPLPVHGIFDFVCQQCALVSNIAWDVQ